VLDAGQVGSLLLKAVQQQQLFSVQRLMQLPAAGHLSSSQAKAVGLAALQWDIADAFEALSDTFDLLQREHLVELMQQVMLLSALGGIDMSRPWCDARMRGHGMPLPARPWRHSNEVLELLCDAVVATQLSRGQKEQLLLTAAELGNHAALERLINHLPYAASVNPCVAMQLLEQAAQHRHDSMLRTVATALGYKLPADYGEALREVAASLLRADDTEMLAQIIGVLVLTGTLVPKVCRGRSAAAAAASSAARQVCCNPCTVQQAVTTAAGTFNEG
jgi:hypothetical protein